MDGCVASHLVVSWWTDQVSFLNLLQTGSHKVVMWWKLSTAQDYQRHKDFLTKLTGKRDATTLQNMFAYILGSISNFELLGDAV